MTQWTVYCHTHIETGRRYIGLTKMTMMQRWNRHVYNSMRNRHNSRQHFPNAIRKYGHKTFSHRVLGVYSSLEDGNWFEKFWILMFDTTNPEFGFNLMRGGQHTPHPIRNPWDRPEYRADNLPRSIAIIHTPVARANNAAVHRTDEYRARMSSIMEEVCSRPDVKSKATSKKLSPETRLKIAAANIGKVMSPETRAKISSVRHNQRVSPEVRAKISKSLTGHCHSLETKEKISATKKLRRFVLAVMNS
jgi:hypothetical protein